MPSDVSACLVTCMQNATYSTVKKPFTCFIDDFYSRSGLLVAEGAITNLLFRPFH